VTRVEDFEHAVLFENRRDRIATTMISIPGGGRNAGLVLFWKLQKDESWLFDPDRSVRESGRRDES
jgi:hypothetical protein